MRQILRRHHVSFKNAFNGIKYAFSTQPNFTVHIIISLIVLTASYFFHISKTEWMIIIFAITFGLVTEMLNTSIEAMTDLITTKYHQQAKIAKDVVAGMMLLAAIGMAIIALIIFLPKLLGLFY